MCEPASIIAAVSATTAFISANAVPIAVGTALVGTATSTATSAIGAQTQAQMAKKQARAARRSEEIQQETLRTRGLQEADATAIRKQQLTDQAREALAIADVSAGESGVGGNSVRSIARDINRQRLAGINAADRNLDATQDQISLEQRGVRARTARQINSINPGPGAGLAATNAAIQGLGNTLMLANAASGIET